MEQMPLKRKTMKKKNGKSTKRAQIRAVSIQEKVREKKLRNDDKK